MECASSKPDRVNLSNIAVHSRYIHLSQRLFEVLELVGANDKQRTVWRRLAVSMEAAITTSMMPTIDCYVFGSSYEGTTTTGMKPDIDFVCINNGLEVVRNISEAPSGRCLLVIQEYSTSPGYCKLQLVHDGVTMKRGDKGWQKKSEHFSIRSDNLNRLFFYYDGFNECDGYERHGPAARIGGLDGVLALRCFDWPDCAGEWLKRKRKHNWPSPNLIHICSTLGFLLVKVGHPNSSEQELQWRLSFSFQERLLVDQFNSVQFKCYIVLKYLKLEIQDKNVCQLFLSSYHLKTAMFYLIENKPSDFWKPENLVSCVIAAFEMIHKWIETDNCPNYFIPDENMFEGKTDEKTRNILCKAIRQIFNDFEHIISQIQRDSLGQLLNSSPHSQIFQDKKTDGQKISVDLSLLCVAICLNAHNSTIRNNYSINIKEFISNLTQLQRTVRENISQEQDKEKQTAWSFFLSFLQVSLLSNIVASDIQENRSKEEIWKSLTCDSWRDLHLKLDSSKLKQASVMYMLEYYQDSLHSLEPLEHNNRFSICGCSLVWREPRPEDILEAGISSDSTPEELLRDMSPCVVFLPNEASVTHIAIRYEMIRFFGMYPESRDDDRISRWYDLGMVDGRFLRHFLLYMNYSKLGSDLAADSKLNIMLNLLKETISHRETCHNLLGWVYKMNGEISTAIHQFKLSLKTKPTNNSAHWHLCFLIRDLLAANSKTTE